MSSENSAEILCTQCRVVVQLLTALDQQHIELPIFDEINYKTFKKKKNRTFALSLAATIAPDVPPPTTIKS